jgi:peptidoglycan/LPS O-acetylase OafA/YrhL
MIKMRIPELDGLRGIAILLAVSFHYLNNQLVHCVNNLGMIVSKIISFGWVGVDLFFVLSGFLMGSILISTRHSENCIRTFSIDNWSAILSFGSQGKLWA